jgi:hypothetical protein
MFSAAHDFADAWYSFVHQPDDGTPQVLRIDLNQDQFPPTSGVKPAQIQSVVAFALLAANVQYGPDQLQLTLIGGNNVGPLSLKVDSEFGGAPHETFKASGPIPGSWKVQLSSIAAELGAGGGTTRFDPAKIRDIGLIFLLAP